MAEQKTKPTTTSVAAFLKGIEPDARRKDCEALIALLKKVTKEEPTMWGAGIVGFGSYHYVYESGREGDAPLVGFSPRKSNVTVYLTTPGFDTHADLMARLGTFTTGKGCLYMKQLSDLNLGVFEQLVSRSVKEAKARHRA